MNDLLLKTSLTDQEEKIVFTMQLLGDKTRFKMFKLLMLDKELCVGEIAEKLDISISAVSQHFRNFEQVGLVDKKRNGQKICYNLKKDTLVFRFKELINK